MKNQKGFTLVELMITIFFLVFVVGLGGGLLYVLFHFVAKFW